jgi:hypothetical protein
MVFDCDKYTVIAEGNGIWSVAEKEICEAINAAQALQILMYMIRFLTGK